MAVLKRFNEAAAAAAENRLQQACNLKLMLSFNEAAAAAAENLASATSETGDDAALQ